MEKRNRFCIFILALLVLSTAVSAANDRPLIYGINPIPGEWAKHPNNPSWEALQYDKMKQAGCAAVRVSIGWDLVEPTPGARNWGDIDADINNYLNRGFEPVCLIVATPTWALLPGQSPPFYAPQPQYRAQFEKFIYDVARRFRGRVKYYEFWNEENGWGWHTDEGYQKAEEYVPWLIHGYNALKKGDPEALWSIGGLDDSGTGYGDDYVRKCYKYMSKGYFDAICEHPYSKDSVAQLWKLDDLRSAMAEYGDALPIWITEMGWAADGRENTVAYWITDYLTRLSSDSYDYCKIATYHTATDFTAEDVGYGLMEYDNYLTTKVTYSAFQNLTKPERARVSYTPAVTYLNPAKVRITFYSTAPATAQIIYGYTSAYGMVTPRETTPVTKHEFEIDGLLPSTTYCYRIRLGAGDYADTFSSGYTFTTMVGYAVGLSGTPSVTDLTHNSATVSWTTTIPSTSKVEYGLGYDYPTSVSDSALTTQHSITLTGLQPNTAYQARIVSSKTAYGNLVRETYPVVTMKQPGLLENGGFESIGPRQPWIIYGRNDGRVTGDLYGIPPRTGSACFGSAASWDHKTGGCYQQVGAVPGKFYLVRGWTKSYQQGGILGDDAVRMGIDPIGDSDPAATSVMWGPFGWSQGEYVPTECMTQAYTDQITIYAEINQPYSYTWNINTIDDVELYQFDDPGSLHEAVSAQQGQNVGAMDVICTANFGDHIYVRSADGATCVRVNATSDAQPGDVVRITGRSSFTGIEKSVNEAVATVTGSGASTEPVGLLIRAIGGSTLAGQPGAIPGTSGTNTLCRLVKVCGSVTESGSGYFRVNDGSNAAGAKVLMPDLTAGPAVGSVVSAWGIASAEDDGGAWAPVVKLRSSSDYRIH